MTLSVHNFGDPISETRIASLFEPMVGHFPGDSGVRSVGLGLYIVEAIATAHNGEVAVISTRTNGTISKPDDVQRRQGFFFFSPTDPV